MWETGVDKIELFVGEGGLKIVEHLAESGLFLAKVTQYQGKIEQFAAVVFEQAANVFVIVKDAFVGLAVIFRLDVKHRIARVEIKVGDGNEVGLDPLGFYKLHVDGEDEGRDE